MSITAVLPALYSVSILVLCAILLNQELHTPLILYVLLVAHACYVFDRVKLRDQDQDPADAIALPRRALLFSKKSTLFRSILVIELAIATVLGMTISPLFSAIPIVSMLCMHLYAGKPALSQSTRLKDIPTLKAPLIGAAHLLFVLVMLHADHLLDHFMSPSLELLAVSSALWLIITSDAILCDIDDQPSDASYGTHSIPVIIGVPQAWAIAMIMAFLGAFLLMSTQGQRLTHWVLGVSIFASSIITRFTQNKRDWIDSRFIPIVLLAVLLEY